MKESLTKLWENIMLLTGYIVAKLLNLFPALRDFFEKGFLRAKQGYIAFYENLISEFETTAKTPAISTPV